MAITRWNPEKSRDAPKLIASSGSFSTPIAVSHAHKKASGPFGIFSFMIRETRNHPSSSLRPLLSGLDWSCVPWHAKWTMDTSASFVATASTVAVTPGMPNFTRESLGTCCYIFSSSIRVDFSSRDWMTAIILNPAVEGGQSWVSNTPKVGVYDEMK